MDLAPYLDLNGRWGHRMGHAEIHDSMLRDGLNDAFSDQHSGWHTEDLVTRFVAAARTRTAGRRAASSTSARRRRQDASTPRSCRSKSNPATAQWPSNVTSTIVRRPPSRGWPSSARPSARTAPSPPATPRG
ncbi:MAG: hypothetical protein IT509_08190 [Rhodocyclaceae bacterium]|nr:hypothetical protein [Rhodocyclaceae bacterium]